MTGRQKPNWGKPSSKPVWWPEHVNFTDVNNNPRPKLNELVSIMEHFRDWKGSEVADIDENDSQVEDHPPMSSSTPLLPPQNTSRYHSTCSPDPPATASPVHISPVESPVQSPVASSDLPLTGSLNELLKGMFGPQSVYCRESWATCNLVEASQKRAFLNILCVLDEDVSIQPSTYIKVLF